MKNEINTGHVKEPLKGEETGRYTKIDKGEEDERIA
jgi:hypothetical protein